MRRRSVELAKVPWVLAMACAGSLVGAWAVSVLLDSSLDGSVVAVLSVTLASAALARERREVRDRG